MKKKLLILVKAIFVVLVLSLAVGFYGQPAQAALVTNGSFEDTFYVTPPFDGMALPSGSTTMPGWTVITAVSNPSAELSWIGANDYGLTPSAGIYFLDLTGYANTSPFAGVQQS